MSRIIEARAVISASDKTGNILDKIASKFKGLEKNAKAMEGIKAPKFLGNMEDELRRLKLSEKQLQGIRKEMGALQSQMHGPLQPGRNFRALDDWKNRTVSHWREVKAGVEDTEKAHKKFFKGAASFGIHAAGIGGAAYMAGHAIKTQVKSLAERSRAEVRYDQMGLSPEQLGEANVVADSLSSKYPSISRTDVLDDLRKNASRLGSFDRAKEIADTYARARISNKISGGDEHELEQVVRALEGAGKANSASEFASGMNTWSKAKAANPDYTGEQFRSDMSAASSAKYGMSKDYMENVFPILASHTSGFGNKLATGLSALVGGRMTKKAKGELSQSGLLGKDGRLVDAEDYISNNFDWTQKHIKPLIEKQGVKFGEHMSEEDKGKTVDWLQHHFSARNAADLMATNLLDEPLVEKARHRKTAGLEGVEKLQAKDPTLALEGLTKQALDVGNAFMGLSSVVKAFNDGSSKFANLANFLRTGELPKKDNPLITGLGMTDYHEMPESEKNRIGRLRSQENEFNNRLMGLDEDQSASTQTMRMRRFEAASGYNAAMMAAEQNKPLPGSDFKPGATSAMPGVQSLEGATVQAQLTGSGEIHGEAKLTVGVTSQFIQLIERAENAIKMAGQYVANGVGSTGKSSPDAAAPAMPTSTSPM